MATELGKAYVQIIPSAKGIKSNIEKELSGDMDSIGARSGERMGSSLVKTLRKVLIAAGIGKILKDAITAGGELEQNIGGTEAVFGKFADTIQSKATDAYKNMGLSASDYMQTANIMGSLFQGSGIEQQRSLDLTADAMQRAADVASIMGVDTKFAMDSIAGAAKGNFTMMDNLGVAMNATTLSAYALENGVNFNWNTASNAEKAELAMKMFMERTEQYTGNFAKESEETFTGSLGAMQASWQDVLGQMATGQDIGPALANLSTTIVTFAQNLMPMLSSVIGQLPTIITTIMTESGPQLIQIGADAIAGIITGLGTALPLLIPAMTEGILLLVETIIDQLPMLIESGLSLIEGLAEGLINAIPLLLEKAPVIIDSIIQALIRLIPLLIETGIKLLVSLIEALPQIIHTIVQALPQIINSIINTLLNNIPLLINAGVQLLTAIIDNLPLIISTIVNQLPQIITAITTALIQAIPQIIQAGIKLLTSLVKNLPQIISTIVKAIPKIIKSVISALLGFGGEFIKIGADLLGGLAKGFTNIAGNLVNGAINVGKGIIGGVKNFFGIRSPSRVFMEIGEELNNGLAKGINDHTKPISKAMNNLGEMTNQSFESQLSMSATTGFNPINDSLHYSLDEVYKNPTPANLKLILANKEFETFVEDITDVQEKELNLRLAY